MEAFENIKGLEIELSNLLGPDPWCIDDVRFEDGFLEITGWALAPEGNYLDVTFTLNDREFQEIDFPLPRPDVAEVFWFKPWATQSAFRCRAFGTKEEMFRNGYLTIKCVSKRTNLPYREEFNYFYPDPTGELPLPGP